MQRSDGIMESLTHITEWHPLVWLWGVVVGILAWLDGNVLPHFVLWGSAGLIGLGYVQKWRGRRPKSPP